MRSEDNWKKIFGKEFSKMKLNVWPSLWGALLCRGRAGKSKASIFESFLSQNPWNRRGATFKPGGSPNPLPPRSPLPPLDQETFTVQNTLEGHSSPVQAVCRLDANTLASASYDQTIKIWDLTTGTCTQTLSGHTGSVRAVCRLDAHTLASGSSDQTIKIWGCSQREKDFNPN